MTNKLALVKKKHETHTQKETKPKPRGNGSPVTTAQVSVHMIGYN